MKRILAGQLRVAEAAPRLHRSHRQGQGMRASYRKEGAATVVHGNRGRKPKQRISLEGGQQGIMLAQPTDAGCTQHHRRDLREDREGIKLSRSRVQRLLQAAGVLADAKGGNPQHRRRGKRAAQEGMLVQIDGRRHGW